MPRIDPMEHRKASLLARVLFFMCKRRLGRVIMPLRVTAHHPRLLRAYAHMELGQEAAKSVPMQLKTLASIRVAMMIGCPF